MAETTTIETKLEPDLVLSKIYTKKLYIEELCKSIQRSARIKMINVI